MKDVLMIFKAKNQSGQWVYSDPIQHQFAWECEALYGFDMSYFDTIIDDAENKLNEQSCNTLQAKRSLAFEAYQQNNMNLLKEHLDYLLLAVNFINQGRAASHLSKLMKAGYVKATPQAEALPIAQVEITPVKVALTKHTKLNRNELDPSIDEAIKQAGIMKLADVYLKLKELAINGTLPFTGLIEEGALCYTNSSDNPAKLSKDALGKRLKRRLYNAV